MRRLYLRTELRGAREPGGVRGLLPACSGARCVSRAERETRLAVIARNVLAPAQAPRLRGAAGGAGDAWARGARIDLALFGADGARRLPRSADGFQKR